MNTEKKELYLFLENVHKNAAGPKKNIKKRAKEFINSREHYEPYDTIVLDDKTYDIHDYLCCLIAENI